MAQKPGQPDQILEDEQEDGEVVGVETGGGQEDMKQEQRFLFFD
jgi:hypothetical protein